MTETYHDDFLQGTPEGTGGTGAPAGDDVIASEPAPRRLFSGRVSTAGWLLAGLAIGAVGVGAWHSSHTSNNNANALPGGVPAAASGTAPGGTNGTAPGAQSFGGGFGGGFSDPGGFGGEQHLSGTIASISGSTIAITTGSGTSSYTIDSSTQLVKDGQQVSSLSVMHKGDSVLLHVYPLNGKTHVERVIDGTSTTTTTTTTNT